MATDLDVSSTRLELPISARLCIHCGRGMEHVGDPLFGWYFCQCGTWMIDNQAIRQRQQETRPMATEHDQAQIDEATLRRFREAGNRSRRIDHLIEMLAVDAVTIALDLNSELDDVLDTLRGRLRLSADEYTRRYL